ncbi:MAG: DUF2079 domain-containing protein [Anaerolineae bacterium]|nr:DUF2079 domain-containing protein [Anaerolineae bacterium]
MRFLRSLFRSARFWLILLMLAYFIYFGLHATQRHLAFETGAFDLGVYVQPLWNFIQGRDFAVSLIEDNGPLRWATHVEPILFLIVPIYKLWPDPRTLLWLQVAGLTLAALPLYALGTRRLHNEWAALTVVAAYFLFPATESVTLFDFHAVAFVPLFLLSAFYFLDRAFTAKGKSLWLWPENTKVQSSVLPSNSASPATYSLLLNYALCALFFILAMSTKEDIPLYVLLVGLYLLVLRRRWGEGGILMGVSLIWFYIATQVVVPAYRTGGGQSIYLSWFETLGDTPIEIVLSPFTQPDKVLALIFRPDALPALSMLTLPLLLLPIAGFPFLLMAAPGLAQSLLSQNPTLRQLETWHYAAPMLPFVMLATIDGLARTTWLVKYFGLKTPAGSRLTVYTSRFTLPTLTVLLLIASLVYHILRGYSPLSLLQEWPEVTAHHQLGREIAATIPANSSVLAQAQLVPYVAHRHKLAIWSGPLLPNYDYIWLDLSHPKLPNRFNAHGELLTGLVIEEVFGPMIAKDGYLLLKKGAERTPIPEELFSFTSFDRLPPDAQPFNAVFGDTLKLVGVKPDVRHLATSETEPQVVLYFETLQKPPEDYQLSVYLVDETGQVVGATDYAQPALFWWPTSRWERGDCRQVRVNTIPWWTGDKTHFSYALGFSRNSDLWDESARLPITQVDSATPRLLANNTLLPITAFRRFGGLVYPVSLNIENKE